MTTKRFEMVDDRSVREILGIHTPAPLTPGAMARSLRVTFYPITSASEPVRRFTQALRHAMISAGVSVIEYEDALEGGRGGKIMEHVVVIAPGELPTGNLPVDHAANLRTTTVVGIVDGPCPADYELGMQERLNSVVKVLAWSIIQIVVFVEESAWTVCTMNGAIIRCDSADSFEQFVCRTLIPKLAAPVVPPHMSDFEVHDGALDIRSEELKPYVDDFVESGPLWERSGLLLFHTSLSSLRFRNRYYQRLAAAYLDHRSGMSYGFLARQLPTVVEPAVDINESEGRADVQGWSRGGTKRIDGRQFVSIHLGERTLVAQVPEVWVLTTRSGCNKVKIDPSRDIVRMGMRNGNVIFETPNGVTARVDCRPSYDTSTILAHAVGNAIVASVLSKVDPASGFARRLGTSGLALAHWHGYIPARIIPAGYAVHGESNPPVSCSTHQAAIYALTGKLLALKRTLDRDLRFEGDIHHEPHHGTNMTGPSLMHLGEWVVQHAELLAEPDAPGRRRERARVSTIR